MQLDEKIGGLKQTGKDRRSSIKNVTEDLNKIKKQIDELKMRIDRKEHERKLRFHQEQQRVDDDFAEPAEEIIDEEELVLLRQMKDLKKVYRDSFTELKSFKQDYEEAQSQIDVVKEQLISSFEGWYRATFDGAQGSLAVEDHKQEPEIYEETTHALEEDDEQQLFKRAKRNVDILHRARKTDKTVR